MDERAEQRVAVREVTVDSAHAHAGELGDGGHWDLLSLAPHQLGGRVKYARAVGGGVFAGLRLSGPNVLLNLAYSIHPPLLLKFERRIFCDLDPSEIFYWMTKMEVGQSYHHEFWTIGLNVHGDDCRLPKFSARLENILSARRHETVPTTISGRAYRNSQPSGSGIGVGRWKSPANFRICPKDLPSNLI